ncbi:MAG: putative lipid II flippase FtsW [Candidatus Gastranaerophilales bacterium]|nr:putative lipid II flippase FtsW [Candidatus Gastranaerophilales bacterium]
MSEPNYNQNQNQNQNPKTAIIMSSYDNTLVFIVLFLIIVGFLAIFSAGAPKCIIQGTPSTFFVARQFIWFILGCIAMFTVSKFNYKALNRLSLPFAWFIIILLLGVHFFGITVNGATRWLALGPIQFQPSEAAKLAVIMLLASAFSKDLNLFNTKMYKYYIPIIIITALIFKQPNLSMVLILLSSSLFMYFAAGGSIKLIISTIAAGIFGLSFIFQSYQKQRIETWLHPESDPYGTGYNIIQSLLAFAAGGFFGEGYGNSRQKLGWLPEGHTDFIFAVLGEEFGFLGCILIIGLFLAFLQRGLLISNKCEDLFGKLLAAGITVSICLQAFINISVAGSMLPATGVPMPFISYGGTSLFITMFMIGILLNISKKRIRRFPNVR